MFKSFGDLLNDTQEIISLDYDKLKHHPKHQHTPMSDAKFQGLVESIKAIGLMNPVIVRRLDTGEYELLSGYTRARASHSAGMQIRCIVLEDISDDEALMIMDDTNIYQRSLSEMPISVQASIITDYYNRNKKQGKRRDLVSDADSNDDYLTAEDKAMIEYELSASEIARYIRITKLIEPFKELLDNHDMAKRVAVELSFLDETDQQVLYQFMNERNVKVSMKQAEAIRETANNERLDSTLLEPILCPINTHEDMLINVEASIKGTLNQKVKVKEQSLTIHYKDFKELENLLKQLNLNDALNFLSSGKEVE